MIRRTDELNETRSLSHINPLYTFIKKPVKYMANFFEQTCLRYPDNIAVICESSQLTYLQLDRRANRLARLLLQYGLKAGQTVGIYMERSVNTYIALLAVLKAGGAFVPLDPSFPADRVAFIAEDASLRCLLTTSTMREKTQGLPCRVLELDKARDALAAQPSTDPYIRVSPSSLCYIIYTSGTTGRPKGVGIKHSNIANFLRVIPSIYDVRSTDRVYQGMSTAFDFSVEEIWPTWISGATLVAGPTDSRRLGHGLTEFLIEHQITVLYCVPTLLATIDEDLPSVRTLLVGGEACPPDLVRRWYRPERRMLNTYGPTETTVTATWCELYPDRPVTIGVPLPTYLVYILDDQLRPVKQGQSGEICIGGPGVGLGYINRPDLTKSKFIDNPIPTERSVSPRLYRSGDVGRFTPSGEIEYLGRIDTQVKIRGYRIELAEIEAVIREDNAVENAVVAPLLQDGVAQDLAAYVTLSNRGAQTAESDLRDRLYATLRTRLPVYMVPSYIEVLDRFPLLAADKVNRAALPAPTSPRLGIRSGSYVAPTTRLQSQLAAVWGQVLGQQRISVEADFFTELGANSLLMARFCARVRERGDLPSVSIKDVYLHPTIRSLAAALEDTAPAPVQSPVPARSTAVASASTRQYILCGTLQFLLFLGYLILIAFALDEGYAWISAGTSLIDMVVRSLVFGCASFLGLCTIPILAKWLLVGRWKPQEIPIWSLAYVRFWFVKTLVKLNPLVLFVGSPLYILYLRALGARIGRGVAIFSPNVPVCTDLLTIGDGTVILKDSFFACYRAHAGLIQMGAVTLGKNVFVGEETMLDIGTSLGDGAQLGHTSSLHAGQAVPDGQHWHGSPAQPTNVEYRAVEPTHCGTLRRVSYSALQLLGVLVAFVLGFGVSALLLNEIPLLTQVPLLAGLLGPLAFTSWTFYGNALVISFVLFFGSVLAALVLVAIVPRVLSLALRPDKVYPLYGFHYWVQRTIARLTNLEFFMHLFGDGFQIVRYLRILGYDLSRVMWTGSNFGGALKHEMPSLISIGADTMISDGLSIINADFSSTSFRVSRASIGSHCYLGNAIAYPSGGRMGDNCLLATKVMVPLDGNVREGVGLLGSPCFEIPRTVQYDSRFDYLKSGEELRRRIAAKNKYNTASMWLFLLERWLQSFAVLLIAMATADLYLYNGFSAWVIVLGMLLTLVFTTSSSVLVDRAATGFRALSPQFCSIYEPYFWWHERLWMLGSSALFDGTPFRNVIWRLLGVRIGRRVFDDGCSIVDKTLVSIGNDCTLNAGSIIQCHSMEDGIFKSDRTAIGANCTIGTKAYIHYGVTMGDGAVLDADSFLMKGEEIGPHAQWRGNPARELRNVSPA